MKVRRMAQLFGATLIAIGGVVGFATSAFAHNNPISASTSCVQGDHWHANLRVENDYNLQANLTAVSPSGLSVIKVGAILPKTNGGANTFLVDGLDVPLGTTSFVYSVSAHWTDGFNKTNALTVYKPQSCTTTTTTTTRPTTTTTVVTTTTTTRPTTTTTKPTTTTTAPTTTTTTRPTTTTTVATTTTTVASTTTTTAPTTTTTAPTTTTTEHQETTTTTRPTTTTTVATTTTTVPSTTTTAPTTTTVAPTTTTTVAVTTTVPETTSAPPVTEQGRLAFTGGSDHASRNIMIAVGLVIAGMLLLVIVHVKRFPA